MAKMKGTTKGDAMQEQDDKSLAVVQTETDGEAASNMVSLTSKMNTAQLNAAVKKMTEQRKIIADFIKVHLKEGVDFGSIAGESKTGKKFQGKPTLFKPGQEKIFSLFGLVSELEKDTETLEMLSDQTGLVAYKCNVYKNGVKIAEGRGAAKIGDLSRDANSTIKIAEKRARMDACLSLGFSEYFTQDMEDPEYRGNGTLPSASGTPSVKPENMNQPISDNQRRMIFGLLKNNFKITDPEQQKAVLKLNGYEPGELTRGTASELIDKMLKKQFNTEGYGPTSTDGVDEIIDGDLSDEAIEQGLSDAIDEAGNGTGDPKDN